MKRLALFILVVIGIAGWTSGIGNAIVDPTSDLRTSPRHYQGATPTNWGQQPTFVHPRRERLKLIRRDSRQPSPRERFRRFRLRDRR